MLRRLMQGLLASSLVILGVAGCGLQETPRAAVRGQVRFKDQALRGGAIVFTPDVERGTVDEMAYAQIKSDGSYQLQTPQGPGLSPGWYRVSIVTSAGSVHSFPNKYRDPLRSGLECEVQSGSENQIDFNLK